MILLKFSPWSLIVFGCPPQNRSVRQFLLTNLVEQNGHYAWRVNLEAIMAHLDHIMSFPSFNNTYEGPTLFLGGASSDYIRYTTRIITLGEKKGCLYLYYSIPHIQYYISNCLMHATFLLHVVHICILCPVFQFFSV